MGELNHPTTADVDLERACHMVTELNARWKRVLWQIKSLINTMWSNSYDHLINDGVKVGMSSRALGTLGRERSDHSTVKNMKLSSY